MSQSNKGRFRPGESGNPNGRAKGSRNRASLAVDELLEGEAERLTRRAVEKAMEGDTVALRLCLDRIAPARRDRHVSFVLPAVEVPADLPKATAAILDALATGELTPSEAAEVGRALDTHMRAVETADLAERIAKLEAAQ